MKRQEAVPIVLGSAGLGLIRSLGERGVKSLVVDDGPSSFRDLSKYCKRFSVRGFSSHRAEAMQSLKTLCLTAALCSGKQPIVFPVSDHALDFVTRHYDELSEFSSIGCGPLDAVCTALSKVKFYEWLSETGFSGPRTIFRGSAGGGERKSLECEIGFPCIVKPDYTYRLEEASGSKVRVASDSHELQRLCREMDLLNMDYVIQEIVPGPIEEQFGFAGYASDGGRIECYVMTNKLRQSHYGAGSFVASAHVPELVEVGTSIVKRLGYRGIFEVEFKRDARDGTFKVIEFNPRCWSQIMLATRLKVNVAFIAFLDLCGKPRGSRVTARTEKRKYWVNFERDLGHMRRKILGGGLHFPGTLKVLMSGPCIEPFDWRDLRPGLHYLGRKIGKRLVRAFRTECKNDVSRGSTKNLLREKRPSATILPFPSPSKQRRIVPF